jgi:hypothetical protein
MVFASTSQTQVVTVTNTGSKKSAALAVSVSSGTGFTIPTADDHCSRTVLPIGASCTLTVAFTGSSVPSPAQFATVEVASKKVIAVAYVQIGTAPPAAPGQPSATPGDGVVTLSWPASIGATSYSVDRSVASGGPYTQIASSVTALTYFDTSVTNGVTYYYVIVAVNAGGSSANSPEAWATPVAPPAAPVST